MKILRYLAIAALIYGGQSLMAMEITGEAKTKKLAELKAQYEEELKVGGVGMTGPQKSTLGTNFYADVYQILARLEKAIRTAQSEEKKQNYKVEFAVCYGIYREKIAREKLKPHIEILELAATALGYEVKFKPEQMKMYQEGAVLLRPDVKSAANKR